MSQEHIDTAGAHWTAREIAQQPEIWRLAARQMVIDADLTRAFIEPLLRRPDLRVVLTGAGTSAFIGECLAPALTRRLGMRVHAIATTDLVAAPECWLDAKVPLLLVSFARSGNSPESVAGLNLAERVSPDCHHLIITCNEDGALYRQGKMLTRAHVVLLPKETNDRGFAMTSSFSSMLLGAAVAFNLVTSTGVNALARCATQVLDEFRLFTPLADAGYERVIYLGSSEFKGLAREAAMKMLELTDGRVVAIGDTPLGFRHGPKSIIDDKTLVVMFSSNSIYSHAYERDLLAELRRDSIAARVIALTASETDAASNDAALRIADAASVSDLELCFPYAVFAQSLALQQSLVLKLRPDTPNTRGVVNRVVQGVSVYPWEPRA